MGNYCPYTNGNVVYLKCLECEDKICEKGWFFCGLGGTPMSMTKSRKQMSEYLDRMLAKREKVVIVAESGKKMAALAAMYASERGYSFIPVANDDLPTHLAKQQQKVAELLEAYTAKERSALDCAEEMADVMEVLYAMGKTCAVSKREIEQVRSQKASEKGTFGKRVFLVSTEK